MTKLIKILYINFPNPGLDIRGCEIGHLYNVCKNYFD